MISHKHRCVFVHIPKCGGQSVEHIFVKENGLTWDTRAPLLLRSNDDERLGPPRLAHLTYQDYIRYGYASEQMMNEYMTFAIVRNPFKRVESLYRFWGYDAAITFEKFVTEVLEKQINERGVSYWFFRPQTDFICDDEGEILVDHLVKLEEIDQTLPKILAESGVMNTSIPHVNKSKEKRGFVQTLNLRYKYAKKRIVSPTLKVKNNIEWSDRSVSVVRENYSCDLKLLGYDMHG